MSHTASHIEADQVEAAVIGAMLHSSEVVEQATKELYPEDFVNEGHRLIFTAMHEMLSAGEETDELTVIRWMKSRKTITKLVGGARQITTLYERTPSVANAPAYIREVKDYALLRMLQATGRQVCDAAQSVDIAAARKDRADHPVRVALDEATTRLTDVRDRLDNRTYAKRVDIASQVQKWAGAYLREQCDPEASLAIPFPPHLPQLNAWTLGQRPGRLIVSSGFTGHGKSWFGLDCSETVIQHGGRVAYFALELPGAEIVERLMSMSGLSYGLIQERKMSYESMSDRINELDSYGGRFTILDGSTSMQRIESEVVRARSTGNPYRYVVIDTLNLLQLPGRGAERRHEIDKALLQLKNISIDHNLTVHVQAQLNRDKGRDPKDPPTLADLKESSGIEQTADLVLFVHRGPGVTAGSLSSRGVISVAKGRNVSRRGQINVEFNASGMRFVEAPSLPAHYVAGLPKGTTNA